MGIKKILQVIAAYQYDYTGDNLVKGQTGDEDEGKRAVELMDLLNKKPQTAEHAIKKYYEKRYGQLPTQTQLKWFIGRLAIKAADYRISLYGEISD